MITYTGPGGYKNIDLNYNLYYHNFSLMKIN